MTKAEKAMLLFTLIALTLWAFHTRAKATASPPLFTRQDQAKKLVPNNPYPGNFMKAPDGTFRPNRPPFKYYNPNLIIQAPNLTN